MSLFITGAGGFLGKHILRQLNVRYKKTIYVTSLDKKELEEFENSSQIIVVDNDDVLNFDFSCIDIVINCAFPRAIDGVGFVKGLDFLNNLFQKISKIETCGLIDISSQSVYDYKRLDPASESSQIDLQEKYDVGKYCMELLSEAYLKGHKRIHLRLASLIGPKFDQRLVNKFVKSVINSENITISGGNQMFGFLDVRDCAGAICTVVNNWDKVTTEGEVYNVGAADSNSLLKIAELTVDIGKKMGYKSTEICLNKSDEWKNSSIDGRKFYEFFGWEPKYSLQDTIEDIFKAENV